MPRCLLFCLIGTLAAIDPCARSAEPGSLPSRAFGPIQPRLAPDEQHAAFSWQGSLCTMRLDSGAVTVLTRDEGFDVEPAWSPDGRSIVFVRSPNFNWGTLQHLRAQDGITLELPGTVYARGSLHFHPDGQRVLGRFSKQGPPSQLAWVNLKTAEIVPLSNAPRSWQLAEMPIALTPDGHSVLYALHQDLPGEQTGHNGPQADLYLLPTGGGEPRHIVRWPARIYGLAAAGTNAACYLVSDLGASHPDLWFVPLADSLRDARKLTDGHADEDWPSTDPAGRFVLHTENPTGATGLVLRDTLTGGRYDLPMDELLFSPAYAEDTATLNLTIADPAHPGPSAARVSVRRQGGKYFAPIGALYRFDSRRMHFYLRGETTLRLPEGRYQVVATRGPEYRVARVELDVRHGAENRATLTLERWTDAFSRGWFSGENHIHANYGYGAWYNTPSILLELCEGEDLNVANLMVANSDGDGVFDREFFRGKLDALSTPRILLYWNQEFRSTIWGHMTLGNLPRLIEPIFTGFKETTNPWDVPTNADIALRTREQGGVASYTHPANRSEDPYASAYSAKGLPVDLALGRIDSLDVMGGGYEASLQVWYRLLRCGFELPASAGTDCFLNRIRSAPPGWGRSYVRLNNGLDYRSWIEGQKTGRSFVSSGPMLEFQAATATAGETLRLRRGQSVRIQARALAQSPLENLELIHDGRVIATGQPSADRLEFTLHHELKAERTGWIAVRTAGPGVPDLTLGRQAAHSNPVYLQIAGTRPDNRADAQFFLDWIDRLDADLRKRDRLASGRSHVATQLNAARDTFRKLTK